MMGRLQVMIPRDLPLARAYASGTPTQRDFVHDLAMFLSMFLRFHNANFTHDPTMVEAQAPEALGCALEYLVSLSYVDDIEILKICLDYWKALTRSLYDER